MSEETSPYLLQRPPNEWCQVGPPGNKADHGKSVKLVWFGHVPGMTSSWSRSSRVSQRKGDTKLIRKKNAWQTLKGGFVAIRTICEVCSTRDQRDVAQLGSRSASVARSHQNGLWSSCEKTLSQLPHYCLPRPFKWKKTKTNKQTTKTHIFSAPGFVIKGSWRSGGVN